MCICGGTSGSKVELELPRLFFKQLEIIGASCGSQEEFQAATDFMADGLEMVIDEILPCRSIHEPWSACARETSSARSCSNTDHPGRLDADPSAPVRRTVVTRSAVPSEHGSRCAT
ncbi:MAG: hypothetical protein M5U19_14040 [Microthrixaceae bacterium]|nr:hypothetical protein [Microthrixaceae bacterium]